MMKRGNARVAQAAVQHFLYLSQNQQEMCLQFFNWLILNVQPTAAAPRNNVLSQACRGGIVKMVCCVDVHLKQLAVTEFLMAEKESLTN
jgi:hypothetical protein